MPNYKKKIPAEMTNRKYKAEKLQHVEYDKQINIQDLVRQVKAKTGYTYPVTDLFIHAFVEALKEDMEAGHAIKILDFLKMTPVYRPEMKNIYDGLNHRRYTMKAHYKYRFDLLAGSKAALTNLNKNHGLEFDQDFHLRWIKKQAKLQAKKYNKNKKK